MGIFDFGAEEEIKIESESGPWTLLLYHDLSVLGRSYYIVGGDHRGPGFLVRWNWLLLMLC